MWLFPFPKNTITDGYGDNEPPRTSPHRGTDFAPGSKSLITAATHGKVTDIYWSNVLGWVCEQESASGKYRVSYCHLNCSKHGIDCRGPKAHPDGSNCMKNLKVGDKLVAGETYVGRVGNTGASRGAHLHLVLGKSHRSAVSGYTKDPVKYIDKQIRKQNERLQEQEEEVTESPKTVSEKPQEQEEATESPVTGVDCEPDVITPDKGETLPKRILEAVRTILLWLKG